MNAATDHLQDRRLGKVCPWYVAYTFDNWLRGLAHKPGRILGEESLPSGEASRSFAEVPGCPRGGSPGCPRLVCPPAMRAWAVRPRVPCGGR